MKPALLNTDSKTKPATVTDANGRRAKLNADPQKVKALQQARHEIGDKLGASPTFSIAALRLKAGLSQTELAALMDTKQPAIARLEKGLVEPKLSTIQKLAKAFNVAPEIVLKAFINLHGG